MIGDAVSVFEIALTMVFVTDMVSNLTCTGANGATLICSDKNSKQSSVKWCCSYEMLSKVYSRDTLLIVHQLPDHSVDE